MNLKSLKFLIIRTGVGVLIYILKYMSQHVNFQKLNISTINLSGSQVILMHIKYNQQYKKKTVNSFEFTLS